MEGFHALRVHDGGGRHYGLYAARAEIHALRGDKLEAEAELRKAWEHGWRSTWRAQRDPFLVGVKLPGSNGR